MNTTTVKHTNYPSALSIGEQCECKLLPLMTLAYVRRIHFTASKVRYDIFIDLGNDVLTTIQQVDSIFVCKITNPKSMQFDDHI